MIAVTPRKPRVRHVSVALAHMLQRLVQPMALAVSIPVAILTQSSFSVYAAAGDGAATVRAPALPVALSVLAALLAALALLWPRWRLPRTVPSLLPFWRDPTLTDSEVREPLTRAGHRGQAIREWGTALTLCAALPASFVADLETSYEALRPQATLWWIGSIALLLLAAWLFGCPRGTTRRMWLPVDALFLALLIALALALRLPNLVGMPYIVHGDEAANGLQALRWLHGDIHSLLDTGWYGLPVAGYGLPALVMRFAGANLYGLRLSSVIVGTLAVVFLYALARELGFRRRVAFLGAGLFAVAHVAIQFSRMGIHYIHAAAVVVLTLWLLVSALRRQSAVAAVLTAVGLSLALQVYFSARVLFVIVPIFLLALWILNPRALAHRLQTIVWLAVGLVVAIGPLAMYFLLNPAPFSDRTNEVLLLHQSADLHAYLLSKFGTADIVQVLLRQTVTVPLLLSGLADQSTQYGAHVGLLDPLVAGLATIGFFLALLRLRQPAALLLVLWVLATTAAGVLTIDDPWWPRLLVMVPALCVLAAWAAEACLESVLSVLREITRWASGLARQVPHSDAWVWLEQRLPGRTRVVTYTLSVLLVLLVLGYSGTQSYIHYFRDYAKLVNTDPYRTRYTDLAYFVAGVPPGKFVILFTEDDLLLGYNTVAFLAPKVTGETVNTGSALLVSLHKHPTNSVVIITPSAQATFANLLHTLPHEFPAGTYSTQTHRTGHQALATYTTTSSPGNNYLLPQTVLPLFLSPVALRSST